MRVDDNVLTLAPHARSAANRARSNHESPRPLLPDTRHPRAPVCLVLKNELQNRGSTQILSLQLVRGLQDQTRDPKRARIVMLSSVVFTGMLFLFQPSGSVVINDAAFTLTGMSTKKSTPFVDSMMYLLATTRSSRARFVDQRERLWDVQKFNSTVSEPAARLPRCTTNSCRVGTVMSSAAPDTLSSESCKLLLFAVKKAITTILFACQRPNILDNKLDKSLFANFLHRRRRI